MLQYDHIGIRVDLPKEGMRYYPEFKLWASDSSQSVYRIEWLCYDPDCELHPLIQAMPHICFAVKDLKEAIRGKKVLLQPTLSEGALFAFIEDGGAPIELIQY